MTGAVTRMHVCQRPGGVAGGASIGMQWPHAEGAGLLVVGACKHDRDACVPRHLKMMTAGEV